MKGRKRGFDFSWYDCLALPYSGEEEWHKKRDCILVKKAKARYPELPNKVLGNFTFKKKGNSDLTDDSDGAAVPPEQSDL